MSDYEKIEKEMSKKGPKDELPKGGSKKLDSEAPEVKKKDGACFKDIEKE